MSIKNSKKQAIASNDLEGVSNKQSNKQYLAQQRKKNEIMAKYGSYQLVQLDCVADYLKENGLL